MAGSKEFDIRDLPSWKYFAWGLLNGLFLGVSIKNGVDISEEGILTLVLDAFKPLLEIEGMSTNWITIMIILIGLLGIISLAAEIYVLYGKGWPVRVMATAGFLSFLLLILGADTIGIILMIIGIITILIFPNE
jgi:hypothetical protein